METVLILQPTETERILKIVCTLYAYAHESLVTTSGNFWILPFLGGTVVAFVLVVVFVEEDRLDKPSQMDKTKSLPYPFLNKSNKDFQKLPCSSSKIPMTAQASRAPPALLWSPVSLINWSNLSIATRPSLSAVRMPRSPTSLSA